MENDAPNFEFRIRVTNTTEYEFKVYAADLDGAVALAQSGNVAPETVEQETDWDCATFERRRPGAIDDDPEESGYVHPPLQTAATHVDDWLNLPAVDDAERLAKEWLLYFRAARPEGQGVDAMISFDETRREWLRAHRLFCTFEGQLYRVTGASRLGDVWLVADHNRENGHDRRVDITGCSELRRE